MTKSASSGYCLRGTYPSAARQKADAIDASDVYHGGPDAQHRSSVHGESGTVQHRRHQNEHPAAPSSRSSSPGPHGPREPLRYGLGSVTTRHYARAVAGRDAKITDRLNAQAEQARRAAGEVGTEGHQEDDNSETVSA